MNTLKTMRNALPEELLCVHVQGPDDVHAFADRESAQKYADEMTAWWTSKEPHHENDPQMKWTVVPWPHSAESHAENLARGDERFR